MNTILVGIIIMTLANVVNWLISNLYFGGWFFLIIILIGSLPYERIAAVDKEKAKKYCLGLVIGSMVSIVFLYVISMADNSFLATRLPIYYLIYCDVFILFIFIGTILGKKK